MIARAAAAPLAGESCAAASAMPRSTLSIGSFTPMTPVDATSTADESHLTASAVRAAITPRVIAAVSAGAGVGAAAVDHDRAPAASRLRQMIARQQNRRGFREVCRKDARRRWPSLSDTRSDRSRLPDALMPQATPAARKPRGAVMPPSIA